MFAVHLKGGSQKGILPAETRAKSEACRAPARKKQKSGAVPLHFLWQFGGSKGNC